MGNMMPNPVYELEFESEEGDYSEVCAQCKAFKRAHVTTGGTSGKGAQGVIECVVVSWVLWEWW